MAAVCNNIGDIFISSEDQPVSRGRGNQKWKMGWIWHTYCSAVSVEREIVVRKIWKKED